MSEVIWIEDASELARILDHAPEVVVDFTAPAWCRPCQQFAPHFEKAAEKSSTAWVAVDVDKAPWAMVEYGVQGVPTVKLFRNNEFVTDLKGRTVVKLLKEIENA